MQSVQTLKFVKKEVPKFVTGAVATPAGPVHLVSSEWSRDDTWGMVRSRSGAFRMKYTAPPGLYAVGEPNAEADVFVTANYKLSFDVVRRALNGMNAWLLVLDTKSINVWCAAGKGTFGTEELVLRISLANLDKVVSHHRIILPQLGAVGVKAGEVQKRTGFRVYYGPVQAKDLPAYVAAGYKKTPEMATIKFPMLDRLILTPMELNPAMKKFPWFAAAVLLTFGLEPQGLLFKPAWNLGAPFLAFGLVAVLAGAFLTPVLLPYVPFRSFALKGWIMGLASMFVVMPLQGAAVRSDSLLAAAAWIFFPAMASYIALQFTGSTTFTGQTGVRKELKIGIPAYFAATGVALILVVVFKIREWGLL